MNSAFLTLWLLAGQTDPADADIAQMQGQWEIVQSIEHGKALSAADLEDQVLLIDGRIIRVREGEKAYDLFELKVYPQLKPKGVDFRFLFGKKKDVINRGIYKLEGRTLTFCIEENNSLGRPSSFTSEKDSERKVIVLKKVGS
jgi:uncharacterized protein (TIGR03067 family)